MKQYTCERFQQIVASKGFFLLIQTFLFQSGFSIAVETLDYLDTLISHRYYKLNKILIRKNGTAIQIFEVILHLIVQKMNLIIKVLLLNSIYLI